MERTTRTDRLDQVMRVLELGQETGILSVERGTARTFEEGWIALIDGQASWAWANQRYDAAALTWLRSWTTCRFAFFALSVAQTIAFAPSASSSLTRLPESRLGESPPAVSPLPEHVSQSAGSTAFQPLAVLSRSQPLLVGLAMIEQWGFPRHHRHVFLLLDGFRTIQDLATLMGRSFDDLETIRSDLATAGLISQQ